MKKTIVITGGAGFIGSHLCERLFSDPNKEYNIICIDNLLTGNINNLNKILTNSGSDVPGFILKLSDACDRIHIHKDSVYAVYHLASPASPVDYQKYPLQTMKVNSMGTFSALELAKYTGAKFLLASTSEVYGDPSEHPQKESYYGNVNTVGPRSCYDESKRFSESLTMTYHKEFGMDTHIARIFNTYGPRMRVNDGRAVPNFINQCLTKKHIVIYGSGRQTRSLCYVDDTVTGLIKLLESDEHYPVNIGNPDEISILDLATEIWELCGSPKESPIEFAPALKDDPIMRRPDITRAKTLLNWKPTIDRNVGLKMTIDYFNKLK